MQQDMHADSGLTWYQVLMVASLLGGGTALGWQGCKKMQAIRVEPQPVVAKGVIIAGAGDDAPRFCAGFVHGEGGIGITQH